MHESSKEENAFASASIQRRVRPRRQTRKDDPTQKGKQRGRAWQVRLGVTGALDTAPGTLA